MKRGRALVERKRKNARQRVEESDDDEEQILSDSDDEVQQVSAHSQGSSARTGASNDDGEGDDEVDDDDEDEEDAALDFTQPDYAVQLSESQPADAQESSEAAKAKASAMPARVGQMSTKTIEDLSALLVRYMLYKASLKLPIKFADISKDVFPKHKNVSRYFFQKARQQLESVFGYRVVAVDDNSSKELYIVLNAQTSQEHLLLMNKNGKSSSRGFLMMVLGLLWCAPARRISEDDLWKQLALLDSAIKPTRDHAQLGDVANLLKTFETQLYLQSSAEIDVDLKKVRFYSYGARTHLEVGNVQILNFVCKESRMDTIVACYGSSASSSESSADEEEEERDSVDSQGESGFGSESDNVPDDGGVVGQKRKRGPVLPWTRAFPHVDGNWPSHVNISIAGDATFHALCSTLIDRVQGIAAAGGAALVAMGDADCHLSLSRPFVLTFDQIEPFVGALRAALKWRRRFFISLRGATILLNDDKTRSFLALRVRDGEQEVINTVKCVDKCMKQFSLSTYYEDPIPHVSIASSLGDALSNPATQDQVHQLFLDEEPWNTAVTTVHVAIGNKHFQIPLH